MKSLRVLYVENGATCVILSTEHIKLDDKPLEIVSCESITYSIELILDQNYDVILLDLSISCCEGLDGLIMLMEKANHIPVVVLVSENSPDLMIKSIQLGASGILIKDQVNYKDISNVFSSAIQLKKAMSSYDHLKTVLKYTESEPDWR